MVNLRTFDLNLLRVFEAIFHSRSVSAAAEKLNMSQPAVSNALNRLRRDFDDPLFVRTNRGMEPTPRAEQIASYVNNGLTSIRSGLASGATFDPAVSERRFTLLMTDVGELTHLPLTLATLSKAAPNIDISVMEYGLQSYADLLESGAVDLAVGRIQLGDNFSREFIHTSPFVVLLSKQNDLLSFDKHGAPFITMKDYLRAPHILVEPRGASGDPIRKALGANAARRRCALSIPHATVLPNLIGGTQLIATIPKVCASNLLTADLCAVDPPFSIEPNLVYQWWHKRNTEDQGHRWLRSLIAAAGSQAQSDPKRRNAAHIDQPTKKTRKRQKAAAAH